MVFFGNFLLTTKESYSCRGTKRPIPRPQAASPYPRRRQPPPTHCGASRRNGRDLIIATRPAHQPLPSLLSAAAAQAVQAIPEPTTSPAEPIPRSQHRQICTCPPRAKGSLNRRFEWFSLVTFFLQKKKVTRAGARNSPSRARRRKKRDGLRRLFLYLISCPCGSATPAPAPARISASCSPPPACRSGCPARSTSRTQTWPR